MIERRRADRALRESEQKFRILAEQSPNMIFIHKGGRVVYVNEKCETVMGYAKEEYYSPGFNFFTTIAPDTREVVQASLSRHTQGKEVEPYEYSLVTKEGERIEAIITARTIDYEGGTAILGIVTDITARVHAEREKERLIVELERALAQVKTLSGLLPICANCKKIRDDHGYWHQVEVYVRDHSQARFSHGLCPECARELYPCYYEEDEDL
jgi:PAS domain S-box-containing protein